MTRSFYAEEETRRPLLVNITSAIFGILAVFGFLKILSPGHPFASFTSFVLDISDIYDIRVLALSFGILISSIFNFVLLFFYFKSVFGYFPSGKADPSVLQIFLSSLVGASVAYLGLNVFSLVFDLQTFSGIFLQGLFSGILGICAIFAVLYAFKNKEFFEILSGLKTAMWKDRVALPEPEKLL